MLAAGTQLPYTASEMQFIANCYNSSEQYAGPGDLMRQHGCTNLQSPYPQLQAAPS